MDDEGTLARMRWACKHHVVFIPKSRRKALYGQLRKDLGGVFRRLAEQKESRVEDGHLMVDHVHMLVSIPPKCAVARGTSRVRAPFTSRGRTCAGATTT